MIKEHLNDMKKKKTLSKPDTDGDIVVDPSLQDSDLQQPCPACLGILQQYLDKPFLTKVRW